MGFFLGGRDALIVVDMQRDFLPGGALAVAGGDWILPGINALMDHFRQREGRIILTQDWHPPGHLSFASSHPGKNPFAPVAGIEGIGPLLWPDHCVAGSAGADFSPQLETVGAHLVIRKGYHRAIDSYSTFVENDRLTPTGLAGYLKEVAAGRIFLCGLALDYCVYWSAVDGRKKGFEVVVIPDLCRGIGARSSAEALQAMNGLGILTARPEEIMA
ncbi:MAG: bifunctional nicotinamidase/pyrazinamidase [Deltaproteobacteria bacterium]|nr:bifunctional nicotinamidase/pyrazinamidase [Deltaproteobacteria bacterium]